MKDIDLMLLAIKEMKENSLAWKYDPFLLNIEVVLNKAKEIRNKQSTVQWNKKGKNA